VGGPISCPVIKSPSSTPGFISGLLWEAIALQHTYKFCEQQENNDLRTIFMMLLQSHLYFERLNLNL
jgi:hypothetical protein